MSDRRNPSHTTHLQRFPERVKITRPHHPFEGQSLEVLRQARMPDGLQFVLILPDGSKSLVPADWTDFKTTSNMMHTPQLIGSPDDLMRLRGIVDALLRRSSCPPLTSGAGQESHATTDSELHRHSHSGDVPLGTTRRPSKTDRSRDSGAPPYQSHGGPTAGADQQ